MSTVQEKNSGQLDAAIVDAIVRQVMERLSNLNSSTVSENNIQSASSESNESVQVLELSDKVITLELLRGRLSGKTRLVVRSDAVVTPAVVDELKERGVQLQAKAEPQNKSKNAGAFCLARLSSHYVPVDWLKEEGLGEVCCGDTYEEIGSRLGRDKAESRTVCFSAQPFAAVATLNKNENVRAAYARTEKEVVEIISTLNANVLVLDTVQPRKELLELIRGFVESRPAKVVGEKGGRQ